MTYFATDRVGDVIQQIQYIQRHESPQLGPNVSVSLIKLPENMWLMKDLHRVHPDVTVPNLLEISCSSLSQI